MYATSKLLSCPKCGYPELIDDDFSANGPHTSQGKLKPVADGAAYTLRIRCSRCRKWVSLLDERKE